MAKEYIERRALTSRVRYIIEKHGLSNVIGEKLKKAIEGSTAADVVEVVRCKACVKRCTAKCVFGDEYDNDVCADDDFCSYGERKE